MRNYRPIDDTTRPLGVVNRSHKSLIRESIQPHGQFGRVWNT